MLNVFYHVLFLIFTIYTLIKCVSYGLYEIHEQENKIGGIWVICLTIFSVIFSNIMVWQN